MEKVFYATVTKREQEWLAILINKINFKFKKQITRDKEGHYILIKGSMQQEDITIINIYVTNDRTSKYVGRN